MFKNPVFAAIGLILLIALGLAASLLYRAPAPVVPQAAAPAPAVRVLRFGHNIPVDSALHQAAVRFAEAVNQKAAGKLRVEVFPAQQLGTDDQMLEMTRQGELEILLVPTAKVSVAVPAMQYADLPFYFPDREDLYGMLDGEPGRMLLDKLRDIDLVGVTFWENGFKHFTGTRPLQKPEDFAGLNIRIMKSRLLQEQFHAFGAHSIPIDFHATRQALADGVVQGQENPLIAIVSMGIHEVQPHLTLSSHGYLGYVFAISAKVFAGLPPDQQQLLLDTARELTPWERQETHRREQELLEKIRAAGVTIHPLDEPQRRRFAAATAHIPARFEDVLGADLLSKSDEMLERKYGATRGERILVGLDADLSQNCRAAGLAMKRGALLAIEEINAAGGVLGKPLELLSRDHKGQPSQGVGNLEFFATRPDVAAVLGGVQANVVVEENEVVHRHGLPFLVAWSATTEVVDNGHQPNYTFRASASDQLAAPFMIDYLLRRHKKPAILVENSVWGRGTLDAMGQRLRKDKLDFVLVETFNRGETDFTPQLARIEQAGADVLVLVANAYEGGQFVQALARRPAPLPVVSHWGVTCGDFWADNREALGKLDFSLFQTFGFQGNPRPASRALAERYRARFGLDAQRDILAPQGVAQAYDLVHLLARAIRKAGSTDHKAIREALEQLPAHEGAVKRYAPPFTPARHDALGTEDYHMARFGQDGSLVRIER